jgi:hypothetical protein
MNLTEWRKLRTEGEAATLPSGLDVRLKRVGAMDLAEKGQIPQEMRPQLEKIIAGQQTRNVTIEEFESFSGVINIVCAASPGRVGRLPTNQAPARGTRWAAGRTSPTANADSTGLPFC